MNNQWMEALAQEHFGTEWAEDAKLRRFVSSLGNKLGSKEPKGSRNGFRDQFVATVSHELRTPLNPILALSQSMRSGVYGDVDERQLEALDHIEQNARHLHLLIEDILDFNEFECDEDVPLYYDPVRGHEMLTRLRAKYQTAAELKGVVIGATDSWGFDGHFYIDSRRVEKMVGLLVDNAIKFTPDGGEVGIELSADPEVETITFRVSDTGIGIAEESQSGLFDSFDQIDGNLSRAYNGTGLGLALVRRMSEHHGGNVDLESVEGEGSHFTITLPLLTSMGAIQDKEILNN